MAFATPWVQPRTTPIPGSGLQGKAACLGRRSIFRPVQRTARMCANEPPVQKRELKPDAKELRSLLKKCPIYFVGCMGCGKSAVAKYVASEIGYRFLDTDELVELSAKKSIPEIFKEDGEKYFRDLEAAVLEQLQSFVAVCTATGGGAVIRSSNWGVFRSGVVVWLNAPADVLAKRLENDTTRPLLADTTTLEEKEEKLRTLLNERLSMYEQADVQVYVDEVSGVDDIGREVMRVLSNFIKEHPPNQKREIKGSLMG